MGFKINSRDVVASFSSISRLAALVPGELARRVIGGGWKSTLKEFQEQLASACSKKHSSGNSPHPQVRSVNQANSLLLEGHGLDSMLQRLNKKAKDCINSIIIIIIIIMRKDEEETKKRKNFHCLLGFLNII